MATLIITAYSPGPPVDDIAGGTEGGPEAALAAARGLCPGREPRLAAPAALRSPRGAGKDLKLSTFGRTILVHGTEPEDLTTPQGLGVWSHCTQTTVAAYVFEVHAGPYDRLVQLCQGEVIWNEGAALPFEEPYWSGARDLYDDPSMGYRFDGLSWARDGVSWMFGWDPAGASSRDRVDIAAIPTHVVEF